MKRDFAARRINVNGIVQGVGFRPFVFQTASRYGLKGKVANTSSGVSIHVEGEIENIESFCMDLTEKKPPLAHVTEINTRSVSPKGFKKFIISKSSGIDRGSTLISPDISVCDDCLAELFNPDDRRYQYPFINCTNCGPRYTIIDGIPYDRPKTSMKHFRMCKRCRAEYDDPNNRRFHAQPNACPDCGPRVTLCDNQKRKIPGDNPVARAAVLLKEGYILAIKGLGGFHLAVNAENDAAVFRLRKKKNRREKPFALMAHDLKRIYEYAHVEPKEETLLTCRQRPIVLVKKKTPYPSGMEKWVEAVSPKNRYLGVMLPYTPLHYLVLNYGFRALVMTSGNRSDEPIVIDNEEAFDSLAGIADYFLIHDREIYFCCDDSIVRQTGGNTRFIRRSRGYVPSPVFLKRPILQILACGGSLKNTICLTRDDKAFLSRHIGDIENLATYDFFKSTIEHMKHILCIDPEIVAYDLHPDYLSTRYALEQEEKKKIPVQHHHAHIAACMAENMADGPVIGLAFDGAGYGTDGNIWGGEVLIVEADRFTRAGHLSYVAMPGSNAAIREPWRMAVSYLYDAFGKEFIDLELLLLKKTGKNKVRIMAEMIAKKINSPLTSSLGRFFDGIASIMGIRDRVSFEGQAAAELEMLAQEKTALIYDYEWISEGVHRIILKPVVRGVVNDMVKGVELSEISGKFHMTLIRIFSDLCDVVRKESGLSRVALSGGVFQNRVLLTGLVEALEEKKFQVLTHTRVPANDGGLSLGQAVIAAAVGEK